VIETSRLWLRRLTSDDLLTIENLWRDETVRQFLGGVISDDQIKKKMVDLQNHWDLHQFGQWVVFDKSSKERIGLCGLHQTEDGTELSYQFFPKFWKKGYAREAATACLHYGFCTLKSDTIIAITQEANISSCQLLKDIGMKLIRNLERFNALQCLFAIDNKSMLSFELRLGSFKNDNDEHVFQ
jgi:ribosomal-protein-alanine N-acetyltransferase